MLHRIAAGVTLVFAAGTFALAWARAASHRVRACGPARHRTCRGASFARSAQRRVAAADGSARSARRQCGASSSSLSFVATAFAVLDVDAARPRPSARRKQRAPMTVLARLRDYYELSKPRIIVLLLITTAASMVMAARGMPPLRLLFWTLLAGALAAASAGAFNCVWDADIDRVMKRTQSRPIPQGRISRRTRCHLRLDCRCARVRVFSTCWSIRWRHGFRWPGTSTTS